MYASFKTKNSLLPYTWIWARSIIKTLLLNSCIETRSLNV